MDTIQTPLLAALVTARPRLTRPRSCTRRGSSFTRCPYCRTSGT